MERGCGRLKLADFDVIELSNLNRIRCGLHELELPKWVVAARTIAEFDPYFDIEIYEDGVTAENVADFVEGCDVVVDACDTLAVKAQLRLEAAKQRCPLVMDTNDRGMLDIERYDHPERGAGFVHGRIDEATMQSFAQSQGWTPEALDAFVDVSNASERGPRKPAQGGQRTRELAPNVHRRGRRRRTRRRSLSSPCVGEDLPDARITMDLHEQLSHKTLG